jgi:hypothetical protein
MKYSADPLKWSKIEYNKQQQIGCHRYDNSNCSNNITYCGGFYSESYFSPKTTAIGSYRNAWTEYLQK